MALRESFTLSNGMLAVFEMPDIPALVGGNYDLPNAALAGILDVLIGDAPKIDPTQRLKANISQVNTVYEIVALCLAEPKLRLRRGKKRPVLAPNEIESADLSWVEALDIYNRFRFGLFGTVPAATPDQPTGGEAAAPAGDDLPPPAE